jgi:hypothetical protein
MHWPTPDGHEVADSCNADPVLGDSHNKRTRGWRPS